jgi:hypothetical protein
MSRIAYQEDDGEEAEALGAAVESARLTSRLSTKNDEPKS